MKKCFSSQTAWERIDMNVYEIKLFDASFQVGINARAAHYFILESFALFHIELRY